MRGNFFYKRLGQKLILARDRKKISQKSLSQLSSVHRTYINRIENGQANPTLKALFKIANALKMSLYSLLEGL